MKKRVHDLGCSCLVNSQDKCDCKQGLDRKILRRAADKMKRRKGGVIEGLTGRNYLRELLRGGSYPIAPNSLLYRHPGENAAERLRTVAQSALSSKSS